MAVNLTESSISKYRSFRPHIVNQNPRKLYGVSRNMNTGHKITNQSKQVNVKLYFDPY